MNYQNELEASKKYTTKERQDAVRAYLENIADYVSYQETGLIEVLAQQLAIVPIFAICRTNQEMFDDIAMGMRNCYYAGEQDTRNKAYDDRFDAGYCEGVADMRARR